VSYTTTTALIHSPADADGYCVNCSPYDPYVPSPSGSGGRGPDSAGSGGRGGSAPGAAGGGANSGNNRTAAIQQEIDATVGIMQDNIRKATERGAKLDTLQDQTGK